MKISDIITSNETDHTLEEVAALIPIVNWFNKKYKDIIQTAERKYGEGEIERMTNANLRAFIRHMGRYRVDWPNVNFYIIYVFLRQVLKLHDDDIKDVVNSIIIKDPTVKVKRRLTIRQIADRKNPIEAKSFVVAQSAVGAAATNVDTETQRFVQKIITDASMRRLERHWEKESGEDVVDGKSKQPTKKPAQSRIDPDIEAALTNLLKTTPKADVLKMLTPTTTTQPTPTNP